MKKNNTIVLDRLEIKLETNFFNELGYVNSHLPLTDEITLYPCSDKNALNNNYRGTAKITYKGVSVGVIHYMPQSNSNFLAENTVHIKFDNSCLYDETFGDVLNALLNIDELGADSAKISRLEIAYDTNEDVLSKFISMEGTDSYVFSKKTALEHKKQPYQKIRIGKFCIYDKSAEISNSKKLYIKQFHKINGLDIDNVFRVELRLDDKILGKTQLKIDVHKLANERYLYGIFKYFNSRSLYFREIGQKNSSRNPKKYLLDLMHIEEIASSIRKRNTASENLTEKQMKMALRYYYVTLRSQEDGGVSVNWALFSQVKERYLMASWFEEKRQFWEQDYLDRIKPLFSFGLENIKQSNNDEK